MFEKIKTTRGFYFRLIFSAGLLFLLLWKIDCSHLVIDKVNWWCLPLIIVSTMCSYLIRSVFYKNTVNLSLLKLPVFFQVTGVYNFISSILPFGIGHLSYPYLLKKYRGVVVHKGLSSLMLYNIIRIGILFFIFMYSGYTLNMFSIISWSVPKILLLIIGFIGGLLFLIMRNFSNHMIIEKLKKFIINLGNSLKENMGLIKLGKLVGCSLLIVVFNVISVYFSYWFICKPLSVIAIYFIFSVCNLSNLLPIHGPGHLGSYEAINSVVLLALNFTANEAIQISFAIHLLGLIIQTVIAIPCYLSLRLASKGFRSEVAFR